MQVLRYKHRISKNPPTPLRKRVLFEKKMEIEESTINRAIKRKGEVLCAYNKFVYNESSTTNQQ